MANIYLIPNLLGESALNVLSPQVAQAVQDLTYFVVENEKSARKFIKLIAPEKPQSELQISVIDKHQSTPDYAAYLTPCLQGHSIGIISEAGCPGVADPGAEIVRVAHQKALRVIPLVGPSSLLLAMMSSGLNGQNFAFNGYLPIDKQVRRKTLKILERKVQEGQSQLFIETPYRNQQLLTDLIETLQPDTLLCIATDLTLPTESIRTLPIGQWKHTSIDLQKRPTLFIIGR
ncbi:SAM-dependent methyltransferase [Capnocytophaga leadbetteri]|uniref:SAM-dependent methyltransferase n=1 Tax=Capnocytophaga leadbetteri TaxID=327575 RepID=UPI0028EAF0CC|nr:SAM-dependent methyltransferase [Capnocytophaga leadbetteri]